MKCTVFLNLNHTILNNHKYCFITLKNKKSSQIYDDLLLNKRYVIKDIKQTIVTSPI